MSRGRLLLVEDEVSIREIARISLERVGAWEVEAAASGAAAIEAAQGGGRFDAVLLDVMMPGLDGPSTMRALRAGPIGSEVPFVFLTAKLQPADRERLGAIGAAGVIAKPFDPMNLADQLDRVLAAADGGCAGAELGAERVHPEFAALWRRRRETIAARVEAIGEAVATTARGQGRPEEVATAIAAAHMLRGSLGTFGLRRGSNLAGALEAGLEAGEAGERLKPLVAELAELVLAPSQPPPMR